VIAEPKPHESSLYATCASAASYSRRYVSPENESQVLKVTIWPGQRVISSSAVFCCAELVLVTEKAANSPGSTYSVGAVVGPVGTAVGTGVGAAVGTTVG
jgi:hypothetical protein